MQQRSTLISIQKEVHCFLCINVVHRFLYNKKGIVFYATKNYTDFYSKRSALFTIQQVAQHFPFEKQHIAIHATSGLVYIRIEHWVIY